MLYIAQSLAFLNRPTVVTADFHLERWSFQRPLVLEMPVDLTPAVAKRAHPAFASTMTLAANVDVSMLNCGCSLGTFSTHQVVMTRGLGADSH